MRLLSMTKSSTRERAAAPAPEAAEDAVEDGQSLRLARLEFGADDRREVADILGDQEIALHEALDARQAAARRIADALGDDALQVEGQALLRAARRRNAGGSARARGTPRSARRARNSSGVNRPAAHEFFGLADAVDVFGDPEERVEVAQSALAVLDVRLDEIARGAGLR